MDAVKFIKEEIRMCAKSRDCCDCPLFDTIYCSASPKKRSQEEAEEIVRRVETWSIAHSYKTRQDAVLEQWPNAEICNDNVLSACPKVFDRNFVCHSEDEIYNTCSDCRRKFWMQEVE